MNDWHWWCFTTIYTESALPFEKPILSPRRMGRRVKVSLLFAEVLQETSGWILIDDTSSGKAKLLLLNSDKSYVSLITSPITGSFFFKRRQLARPKMMTFSKSKDVMGFEAPTVGPTDSQTAVVFHPDISTPSHLRNTSTCNPRSKMLWSGSWRWRLLSTVFNPSVSPIHRTNLPRSRILEEVLKWSKWSLTPLKVSNTHKLLLSMYAMDMEQECCPSSLRLFIIIYIYNIVITSKFIHLQYKIIAKHTVQYIYQKTIGWIHQYDYSWLDPVLCTAHRRSTTTCWRAIGVLAHSVPLRLPNYRRTTENQTVKVDSPIGTWTINDSHESLRLSFLSMTVTFSRCNSPHLSKSPEIRKLRVFGSLIQHPGRFHNFMRTSPTVCFFWVNKMKKTTLWQV